MRCLKRNKVQIYYCLYTGKVAISQGGYETGDYRNTYATAVSLMANVSPAQGEAQIEQFGNTLQYDKVIIVEDKTCPIDENTVLFIDKQPEYDDNDTPLFDYIVKRVARSINGVSYAISKVKVS